MAALSPGIIFAWTVAIIRRYTFFSRVRYLPDGSDGTVFWRIHSLRRVLLVVLTFSPPCRAFYLPTVPGFCLAVVLHAAHYAPSAYYLNEPRLNKIYLPVVPLCWSAVRTLYLLPQYMPYATYTYAVTPALRYTCIPHLIFCHATTAWNILHTLPHTHTYLILPTHYNTHRTHTHGSHYLG